MTFFYFRRQKKSGLSSLGYGMGQPGIPDDFYIRRLDGYSTVTSQVESPTGSGSGLHYIYTVYCTCIYIQCVSKKDER
jgi:hypothetical protein